MVQDQQSNSIIHIMGVMNSLHRLALAIAARCPENGPPDGMTISQLAIFAYLSFMVEEDVYQRDLEAFFRLRRSTVSSTLTTLEKKGLVYRVSVPHDARLKKIQLTERGQEIGLHVQSVFSQTNNIAVNGIPEKDLAVMNSALAKIQWNLDAAEA